MILFELLELSTILVSVQLSGTSNYLYMYCLVFVMSYVFVYPPLNAIDLIEVGMRVRSLKWPLETKSHKWLPKMAPKGPKGSDK